MRRVPSHQLGVQIGCAVQLWAAGNSWEAIAGLLKCPLRTCQRWPIQYPELWAFMTQKVEEERWKEMCATFDRSLREMLRCDDVKYRRKAAKMILQGARRDPPMVSAEAVTEARLVLAREGMAPVRVTRVTVNEGAAVPSNRPGNSGD